MKRSVVLIVFLFASIIIFAQKTQKLSEDKIFKTSAGLQILCQAGTEVKLSSEGFLLECVPKSDFSFVNPKKFRYVVAGGKKIIIGTSGYPESFVLKHNAVVETALGDHYSALGGNLIEFYPSGLVKGFVPKFPVAVSSGAGIKYTVKSGEYVTFYESGAVKSFVPIGEISLRDTECNLHKIDAGKRVELDASGRLISK